MLGDNDEEIRMLEVNKVLSIRQKLSTGAISNIDAMTESVNEEHSSESTCDTSATVRSFDLSTINLAATSFDKMVDLNSWQYQPPAIGHLSY